VEIISFKFKDFAVCMKLPVGRQNVPARNLALLPPFFLM